MIQDQPPINLKAEYKAISILCNALIIGVSIFLVITAAYVKWLWNSTKWDDSMDKIFLAVVSIVAAFCLVSAFTHYNKQMTMLSNTGMPLKQKLETYRATLIRYMALCEGAALFAVICFFLTANYWFMLISLIMLAAMTAKRPTKSKMINELQLDSQQQIELH